MIDTATASPEQLQSIGAPEYFRTPYGQEFTPVTNEDLITKANREAAARDAVVKATAQPDRGTEVLRQRIDLKGAIQRGRGLVMIRGYMAESAIQ